MTDTPENLGGNSAIMMRGQPISDDTIPHYVQWIQSCPNMTVLNLENCSISDEGAKMLAEAIGKHPSLYKVNLRQNDFGDEGACAIMKALEKNRSVRILDIGSCGNDVNDWENSGLTRRSFEALESLLDNNPVIDTVIMDQVPNVNGNDIGYLADIIATHEIADFRINFGSASLEDIEAFDERIKRGIEEGTNRTLSQLIRPGGVGLGIEVSRCAYSAKEAGIELSRAPNMWKVKVPSRFLWSFNENPKVAIAYARHIQTQVEQGDSVDLYRSYEELEHKVKDFIAAMPEVDMSQPFVKAELFEWGNEYCTPLDNPKIADDLPEILQRLREQGDPLTIEDLKQNKTRGGSNYFDSLVGCGQFETLANEFAAQGSDHLRQHSAYFKEDGRMTDLLQLLHKTGQVSAIFNRNNWRGAEPGEARALFEALPERMQEQVNNFHALTSSLGRTQSSRER